MVLFLPLLSTKKRGDEDQDDYFGFIIFYFYYFYRRVLLQDFLVDFLLYLGVLCIILLNIKENIKKIN